MNLSAEANVDIIDTLPSGGSGDMGKRHPSPSEWLQAIETFNSLQEVMPTWRFKRHHKWKDQEEGRIILHVSPGKTFSADPRTVGQYRRENKVEIRGIKNQSHQYTDYGIRTSILCPSISHPHYDVNFEMVGLVQQGQKIKVQRVTWKNFVAHTGSSCAFEIKNRKLTLGKDMNPKEGAKTISKAIQKIYDQIMDSLMFNHMVIEHGYIQAEEDVTRFCKEIVDNGFSKAVPSWLHNPPTFRSDTPRSLKFTTDFQGVFCLSGHTNARVIRRDMTICVDVDMKMIDGYVLVQVGAEAVNDTGKAYREYDVQDDKVLHTVPSREGLEEFIIQMIDTMVWRLHSQSKRKANPIMWNDHDYLPGHRNFAQAAG